METIFKRRSIRKFTADEVEDNKIELMLRAAMQAPSAGNQQPAEFIVVRNKEILEKLAAVSPYASAVKNAPLAFVLLANKNNFRFAENWQMDLSAAAENLWLEAVHLGLGTVWLGIAPLDDRMQAVTKIFSLPPNILPFAVMPVGYPDQTTNTIDRYNAEKVHFEKY